MTGQDLIDWIYRNDAQDMVILVDTGKEIAGYTVSREITPTILPSVGNGIEDNGVMYSVVATKENEDETEDVVVL